jgi:hypothetical protein
MYRDGATDFEYFAGYRQTTSTLRAEAGSQRILIALVTADFFKVLGVNPAMGRAVAKEEDAPGRNNVAVISHGLWQTRFGGNPSILGKTVDLDGQPSQIIGVMPQTAFRTETKIWKPMGLIRRARG